jgi:UPF0271 protein
MFSVDLNSDLGESFGTYVLGHDRDVMKSISSANIACGFHAGDPRVMLKTVEEAVNSNVAVGAHPGYPDLMGFGRRNMACSADEVYAYCLYQIGAIQVACKARGAFLQHVKPHGAMYNQAAKDLSLAEAIAQAVKDAGDDLILLGLANSSFEKAANKLDVPFAIEAFADRAYQADGSLVPRKQSGAVIQDVEIAAKRVIKMVTEGAIEAIDGTIIYMRPHSICLHGDTPSAVAMAATIRETLLKEGIAIRNIKEVLKA